MITTGRQNKLVEIVAGLLIFLFVYTALNKLSNLNEFRNAIQQTALLGDRSIFFSWLVPITELIIAIVLFIPSTRNLGLWSSLILMLLFTGYTGYILAYAEQLPCTCAGVLKQMTWQQQFIFNIAISLICLASILLHEKNKYKTITT